MTLILFSPTLLNRNQRNLGILQKTDDMKPLILFLVMYPAINEQGHLTEQEVEVFATNIKECKLTMLFLGIKMYYDIWERVASGNIDEEDTYFISQIN